MKTRKTLNSTKTNFGLDVLLLIAFLITTAPRLSGMPIHEWLSIAFGAAIVIAATVVLRAGKRPVPAQQSLAAGQVINQQGLN